MVMVHPSLFTSHEIEAYEREILSNPRATETDASRFFDRYPKFLLLGSGVQVRREVVLTGVGEKTYQRVDFFRKSYGTQYWDLIELKGPGAPFVVDVHGQHPKLSAQVDKAIDQSMDYRDGIIANQDVRECLRRKGILVCRPQLVVVAGKHSDEVPPEVLEMLYDRIRHRGPVEVWSYTRIYEFAKDFHSRTQMIMIPAMPHTIADHIDADSLERSADLLAAERMAGEIAERLSSDDNMKQQVPKSRVAYCVKCHTQQEMRHVEIAQMKNKKLAFKGICPVCGTGMYRIGRSE